VSRVVDELKLKTRNLKPLGTWRSCTEEKETRIVGEVLMATFEDVRRAILKVAGNPDSGVVRDLSAAMARAVVALDEEPMKETRVMKAKEIR